MFLVILVVMIASCVRGSTISAHGRPHVLFEAKAAEAAAAEAEAAVAAEVTNKVPEAEAAATTEVAEPQIEAMEVRNGQM